jgi:phosphoglycerate kinase
VVLMSHLGRPDGQRIPRFAPPVAAELEKLLGRPVTFLDDCVGPASRRPARAQARRCRAAREPPLPHRGGGQGEAGGRHLQKADPKAVAAFRASLSRLGDVYVNDAFGTAHRAHSSMVGVSLPQKAAGFLMEAELKAFAAVLDHPRRPLLAILGGAKIADKIPLIKNLIERPTRSSSAAAWPSRSRRSLKGWRSATACSTPEGAKIVPELVAKAKARGVKLVFPVDYVCADKFARTPRPAPADDASGIPPGWMGLDAGPKSIALYREADPGRRDHHLERTLGRLRVREVRRVDPRDGRGRGRGDGQSGRDRGHGRRRHRHRREEIQGGRQGHPLLDRRRRQPRIPRGQVSCPAWPSGILEN